MCPWMAPFTHGEGGWGRVGKAVLQGIKQEGLKSHPHPPPVLMADITNHLQHSSRHPTPGSMSIAIQWISVVTMVETDVPHLLLKRKLLLWRRKYQRKKNPNHRIVPQTTQVKEGCASFQVASANCCQSLWLFL